MRVLSALLLLLIPCLPAAAQTCDPNTPPSTNEADFIDNGDGTATHKTTGLVWMHGAHRTHTL